MSDRKEEFDILVGGNSDDDENKDIKEENPVEKINEKYEIQHPIVIVLSEIDNTLTGNIEKLLQKNSLSPNKNYTEFKNVDKTLSFTENIIPLRDEDDYCTVSNIKNFILQHEIPSFISLGFEDVDTINYTTLFFSKTSNYNFIYTILFFKKPNEGVFNFVTIREEISSFNQKSICYSNNNWIPFENILPDVCITRDGDMISTNEALVFEKKYMKMFERKKLRYSTDYVEYDKIKNDVENKIKIHNVENKNDEKTENFEPNSESLNTFNNEDTENFEKNSEVSNDHIQQILSQIKELSKKNKKKIVFFYCSIE